MAKIYDPPAEIGPIPELDFDNYQSYEKATDQWTQKLKEWCILNNHSKNRKYVGKIVREPVADGYAEYMVYSLEPLELIHLPLGDAYNFRWAHRWLAEDIKEMIERNQKIKELFGQ